MMQIGAGMSFAGSDQIELHTFRMQSDTELLTTCQQIYSRYLNASAPGFDAASLMAEIQQMVNRLQSEIRIQSESGANTVLLEKMQEDLRRISEKLSDEN